MCGVAFIQTLYLVNLAVHGYWFLLKARRGFSCQGWGQHGAYTIKEGNSTDKYGVVWSDAFQRYLFRTFEVNKCAKVLFHLDQPCTSDEGG